MRCAQTDFPAQRKREIGLNTGPQKEALCRFGELSRIAITGFMFFTEVLAKTSPAQLTSYPFGKNRVFRLFVLVFL